MYLLFDWASPFTGRGSWRDAGTRTRKGNFETYERFSDQKKKTAFAKGFWTDPCPPLRVVRVVQVETVETALGLGPVIWNPAVPAVSPRRAPTAADTEGHSVRTIKVSSDGMKKVTYCTVADRLGNPTVFVSNNAVPISALYSFYESDLEIKVVCT